MGQDRQRGQPALDAIEKAIRKAFEKGDASKRPFREKVYRSAFAALERTLEARDDLSDDAKLARRDNLKATITERVKPGVVYTTFHNPETGANVVTTEYSDWATNCPEYKVTAVQVAPASRRSKWQAGFDQRAALQGQIVETS